MSRFGYVVLCLSIALLAVVGCSQDEQSTPTALKMDFGSVLSKAIGPSEIALCLDVSDSVSADELAAVVAALGSSLADPDLIPQDGKVAVGAVVYGDTIATLLPLVAVTPDNLTNTILPALEGLLTDRGVTTAGVDLAAGLNGALALLAPGTVQDQHILLVGTGEADDAAALDVACAAVVAAGVMNSTLLNRENPVHMTALEGCVTATNGYFQKVMENLEGATAAALNYMLLVEMEVGPNNVELARGEDHTVTARIFRGGDEEAYPVVGHEVDFAVVDGPNSGAPVSVMTDSVGMAAFTYTGSGGSGIDTIAIGSTHPGTGEAFADTLTVTWLNTPPTCDAGGPYTATVLGDTVMVPLDGSGSADADGDTLTYMWSVDFEGASFDDATAVNPVLTLTGNALCADSLMVHLMVSDSVDSSACEAVLAVDDQRAPVIELRDEPIALWPPNHKYQTITPDMVFLVAEDACGNPIDLSAVEVVSVSSDEPEDHKGDGHTMDDILIGCPNEVMLRAERMGGSSGRVYTIHYRVTGDNGQSTDAEFLVVVPHDSSGRTVVAQEGMGYTVTPDCGDED